MKRSLYFLLLAGCTAGLAGCGIGSVNRMAGEIIGDLVSGDSGKGSSEKEEQQKGEDNPREDGEDGLSEESQDVSLKNSTGFGITLEENYRSEWNNGGSLLDVTYDSLSVTEGEYPELAAALKDYHEGCEREVADWKQQYLPEVYGSFGTEYFRPYEYQKTVLPQRMDSRLVSFAVQNYEYLGGAHGGTYFESRTFDSVSGKELALADVVNDLSQLSDALVRELEENYPMEYADGSYRERAEYRVFGDDQNREVRGWALGYYGMVFYFDSYELGAYSMGCPEVIIPFAKYPGLFREEYTQIPEEYAVCLRKGGTLYDDTDGDGVPEEVYIVSYNSGEGYGEEKIQIYIDKTLTDFASYGWFDKACLMRQKDGTLYLYVGAIGGGDEGFLHIFRIDGENAVYIGDDESWGYFHLEMMEKPSCFKLVYDLDALGTYYGYRYSCVGSDGMPQPLEEDYTIFTYSYGDEEPEDRSLTTKIPVPVWVIDEQGRAGSTPEQLPAGTKLYFRKTDNKTYVEMELEDGRRCQVRGEFDSWPKTINGISEFDCFDGVVYAG